MDSTPLVLVVGDDRLTEHVCAELTATAGHRVRIMSAMGPERQEVFRKAGASVVPLAPDTDEALRVAGVEEAASILTLSEDDGLNLSVALRARVLNPRIRLVLLLFDQVLGRKLEQNLDDCTVLSLAAHAASTFAGSALDPTCLFAVRFREADGPLVGFMQSGAADLGIAGMTVLEAEAHLQKRIVALGNREDPSGDSAIAPGDCVTAFGRIVPRAHVRGTSHGATERSATLASARRVLPVRALSVLSRMNPVLVLLVVSAIAFTILSYGFFHFALGKSWTEAAFYVAETLTNVGYGEVDLVTRHGLLVTAGTIVAMIGGIIFTSIFIGYVSSAITRAQWVAVQGLRRIRARDHVVICGAGKVGTAVMNLLADTGKRVIIVEPHPRPDLVRRARDRDVDLLTGDARVDDALGLCDLSNATAFLALTDNDASNLEIALGARIRAPGIPLVVRMEDPRFANAAAQLLDISTFSPSALSAPAFAGLSRFPGTRGRVRYGDEDHTIGQRTQGEVPMRPPARDCTALCVWRKDALYLIRTFEQMQPFDVVLFSVPLGQFRQEGSQTVDVSADA